MAHLAQRRFFERVKGLYLELFIGTKVLDCGSLDVNGSFRDLFDRCEYIGIDIAPGKGVDWVGSVADFIRHLDDGAIRSGSDSQLLTAVKKFDVIVSGEMLEHDETWQEDIQHMIDMLRPGGLLAFSCAGKGRPEHGTARTGNQWGTSPDYYRNLEKSDIKPFYSQFSEHAIFENDVDKDLYFYGIKK